MVPVLPPPAHIQGKDLRFWWHSSNLLHIRESYFFSLSFYYIQFDFSFLKVITFFCHLPVEMDFFFSLYGVRGLVKTEMFNFFNQYCWLKAVSFPFLLEWSSSISWVIFLKPVHSRTAWGLIRFLGILPWVNLKSWYSTPFLTWLQNSSSTHFSTPCFRQSCPFAFPFGKLLSLAFALSTSGYNLPGSIYPAKSSLMLSLMLTHQLEILSELLHLLCNLLLILIIFYIALSLPPTW